MLALYLQKLETEERTKIEFFYKEYEQVFLKIALKILPQNRAEDAVQETFIEAIKQKEKTFKFSSVDFLRWGVIVVKNKSIDILRREKNYTESVRLDEENTAELPSESDIEIEISTREDFEILKAVLKTLGPQNTLIFQLKYIMGKSFEEISKQLNMKIPQINGRLARVREKIRKAFDK
jgi:RNA polymerase sigma-70 factor (ECF subfamily)